MHSLAGVYAAAVTPIKPDLSPDPEGIASLAGYLAERGCHGILLLGTTGKVHPSRPRNERRY